MAAVALHPEEQLLLYERWMTACLFDGMPPDRVASVGEYLVYAGAGLVALAGRLVIRIRGKAIVEHSFLPEGSAPWAHPSVALYVEKLHHLRRQGPVVPGEILHVSF